MDTGVTNNLLEAGCTNKLCPFQYNSISTGLLQWFSYERLSVYVLDSQFVMLGGRQTIFLTPYFQFEKKFDFLFVYVMNTVFDLISGLFAYVIFGKKNALISEPP